MTDLAAYRRILIVDDDQSIYQALREILDGPLHAASGPVACRPGGSSGRVDQLPFEIQRAAPGQGAWQMVTEAACDGQPFCIAFVDLSQPLAGNQLDTARRILQEDPQIQVVLCISVNQGELPQLLERFAAHQRLMLLRKPLVAADAYLLTLSLAEKWRVAQMAQLRLDEQAAQIDEARRVMGIFENCLDELQDAHDELRQHAVELTGRLQQRTIEVLGTRDLAMFALAQLADSRDPETGEHLLRMRAYAQLLARHLSERSPYSAQIDHAFLGDFYRSTPLHDIGKVGIPDQILLKPGPLSDAEFDIMKQHTVIGAEALQKAARQNRYGSFLTMAAQIARSHHERMDGKGYPDGLQGQQIPLAARITTLADVFDALTSPRVYKDAMPAEEARQLIEAQEGTQFDPVVVEAFRACFDSFVEAKRDIDESGQQPPRPLVSFDSDLPLSAPLHISS